MVEDIVKNNCNNNEISNKNKKAILLVTNNIQHYQQEFNNYNINNYEIIFVNWNDVSSLIANNSNNTIDIKRKNLELTILDIPAVIIKDTKINQISIDQIEKIKETFSDKRTFFILPFQSMTETFLAMGICAKEDIRIQPFSVFDLVDLISTLKQKGRLYRLHLKDHCMHTYSSPDDKIRDAIKFLKIGIENNETTLILLDKDIDLSDIKSQMALYGLDLNKLQDDGLLKIGYSQDWYLSLNQKNNANDKDTITVDNEKAYRKFFGLADEVINKEGKKGLRIFGMMDCFFEHGLLEELVNYDCIQPPKFNKPVLSICAYSDKFIDQLSEDQIRKLVLTHRNVSI